MEDLNLQKLRNLLLINGDECIVKEIGTDIRNSRHERTCTQGKDEKNSVHECL